MRASKIGNRTHQLPFEEAQDKGNRPRRKRPEGHSFEERTEQGSVIWTILLIGLTLCLADVAYILSYVDNQQDGDIDSFNSIQSPVWQIDQMNQQPIPANRKELMQGKERILKIMLDAGIHNLDDETLAELPTWKQVVDLYGPRPKIYGLEQCETFQKHSPSYEHFVSTAGTFNSGTNLMAELLIANCHMHDRMAKYGVKNRGVRWQVPWGKHTPPGDEKFRNNHKTLKDAGVSVSDILPAVTIRDPYTWMESMCRINYGAHWYNDRTRHCPNLLPDDQDLMEFHPYLKENKPVGVHVRYSDFWKHHQSLAHFWNDWYGEYVSARFSRIMVRYEDLIFHTQEVTETVCACAGGIMFQPTFKYVLGTAKKGTRAHGSVRTGFIDALIKYGNPEKRGAKFTDRDLEYTREHLSPEMMEIFGYQHPPKRDDF